MGHCDGTGGSSSAANSYSRLSHLQKVNLKGWLSMNLDKLINIVGLVSVVLSLIFVGVEISQNTNVSRNQAYLNFSEGLKNLTLQIATDEHLPLLAARAQDGETTADFSPENRMRMNSLQIATVRTWEGLFRSVQSGILPENVIRDFGGGALLNNDYFREQWPIYKRQHTLEFIDFFEQQPWNH